MRVMRILAADTSTASGSVSLLEDSCVVAEWTLRSAQTHNRRLLKTIDMLLQEAGWSLRDVDGFAVTTGPGSFTGVRIGLTGMKTLAWTLNKPFAGISSLDALSAPLAAGCLPVCALIDAHRNEVYCALYQTDGRGGLHLRGSYDVLPPDRIAERIDGPTVFCGNGWLAYRELFLELLGDRIVEAPVSCQIIRASAVGELALTRFRSGDSDDPLTSVPLYVRPSQAELNHPHG